jgi:hypothetical protein
VGIIGLSFDENPDAAKAISKQLELPWPIVIVPNERDARDLGKEAARIEALPRVLLIDQQGTLRFDSAVSESKLADNIAQLLAKSAGSETKDGSEVQR